MIRVYGQELIKQSELSKNMNFQIKTRIFENFQAITKCAHCNSVVYDGLLPRKRIDEGLNMKQWICTNRPDSKKDICRQLNINPFAMVCKKCNLARPKDTIPPDIMFEPFLPQIKSPEDYHRVRIMEQILILLPLIKVGQQLSDEVKALKKKLSSKDKQDFETLNLLEDFSKMRANFVQKIKEGQSKTKQNHDENTKKLEEEEAELYRSLCAQIEESNRQREEHQL